MTKPSSELKFDIGHVLFIDIVGYSKLLIAEQSDQIPRKNPARKLHADFLGAPLDNRERRELAAKHNLTRCPEPSIQYRSVNPAKVGVKF